MMGYVERLEEGARLEYQRDIIEVLLDNIGLSGGYLTQTDLDDVMASLTGQYEALTVDG